jgi:hypothetical protein
MVRILSNGEIVPDDDPRAQQAASNRGSNSARPRQVQDNYVYQSHVLIIRHMCMQYSARFYRLPIK